MEFSFFLYINNTNSYSVNIKIMYLLMFRLRSQRGAFHLMKAKTGGSGIRELIPLDYGQCGYSIQSLKEEVKASAIYIIPLNENIDDKPDVTLVKDVAISTCSFCNDFIPLVSFQEHKQKLWCEGKFK